ncbi:MAG: nitrophenyl compound nitroreductase subunit ArsF family protein [Terrimicrobiaceae bacterium]
MKKILTYGLLALAVVGAGFAVKQRMAGSQAPPATEATFSPDSDLPAKGRVITYFTSDVRCPSCLKIEELTRKTVKERFAGQLQSGELVFRTLNTDRPENKHFVDDYQLVSKTVIVSTRENGKEIRFENLQDVWLKLNDPAAFQNYIAAALE